MRWRALFPGLFLLVSRNSTAEVRSSLDYDAATGSGRSQGAVLPD
jgi:hypothetical protein